MARLTDRGVAAVKPTDKRQQITDDNCKGLYLIVQPTGKKSWTVRYRVGDVQRRYRLGDYPALGLSGARDMARKAMSDAQEGKDPQGSREASKADTVAAVVQEFNKFHLSKLKSGADALGFLNRSIVKEWGDRPVRSIEKREVSRLILGIVSSGRNVTANRTLAHAAKFFNWCAEHGYIDHPPTDRIKMPAEEKPRDRILSHDEIRWFWAACDSIGYPWGSLGQLLLLTGQRRGEVAGITDSEINGDVWRIPAERTKNGLPHDVPLSGAVLALIASLPRIDKSDYLFTTTGEGPVDGFTNGKKRLRVKMEEIAGAEIPSWTWHDLRRTLESGMAQISVSESIVSRITNHVSDQPRMGRVYNHYDYMKEKREALEAWANKLDETRNA